MSLKKKTRLPSKLARQFIAVIDQYTQETGDTMPDLNMVAAWGRQRGLLDLPPVDIIRQLARLLARAARQDYIEDENGEPVRHRHAYKEKRGDKQLTLWFKMEDATPQKMHVSLQSRRNASLMDNLQIERDRRYFDKHYNPGDPLPMDYNYNPDVAEHFMPSEYPDSPPEPDENQSEE